MRPLVTLVALLCCWGAIAQDKIPASPRDTLSQTSTEPVYRVGGSVKPPRSISSPNPDYPNEARKRHGAGPIELRLIVGSDGQPRDVKITLGISPELDQAAVEAVKKWKFKPATKDGRPVSVAISVHFDFQPN